MAEENLPKADGARPTGTPPPGPIPTYSQDVIYAGAAPPAPPVRSEAIAPGTPESAPPPQAPGQKEHKPAPSVAQPHRSEIRLFFSWLAGVFIILVCGWGLIGFFCYLDRWFRLGIPFEVASAIGGLGSLAVFFLLEKNLWLSRFMGLRLGPHSTQVTETLFFFFTGVVGLLLRSSDAPAPAVSRAAPENDGTREIVETVVFVVVLVLLLKTFLVEAFVIPTGSMADTLYGYHKDYTCEKCQYHFVVNCSSEAEPPPDLPPDRVDRIVGGICPICRHPHVSRK